MLVTVLICTWNRVPLLAGTLARLEVLTIPAGCRWELLVIDNGCTDGTAALLTARRKRLPLRVECEPRLGIACARNRGLEAARGDLVLLTDDDTLVDPGWLAAYVAALGRWPEAAYFGGQIDPLFERPPARWLAANRASFRPMLSAIDLEGRERPIGGGEQPYGPNMALRRAAIGGVRLDERLGRRGGEQVRGSDVHLVEQLRRRGCRGAWIPAARVQHVVPPERASLAYAWRYHEGMGRTRVRLRPDDLGLGAAAIGVGRGLAGAALKALAGRRDWPVHLARAAHFVGCWREQARRGGDRAAEARA